MGLDKTHKELVIIEHYCFCSVEDELCMRLEDRFGVSLDSEFCSVDECVLCSIQERNMCFDEQLVMMNNHLVECSIDGCKQCTEYMNIHQCVKPERLFFRKSEL